MEVKVLLMNLLNVNEFNLKKEIVWVDEGLYWIKFSLLEVYFDFNRKWYIR